MHLTAVVRKEGNLYVSWSPDFDVASQGKTIEESLANLKEAAELYLEDDDARLDAGSPFVTTIDVRQGKFSRGHRA
jgi:predicted RNase H-like HicB family nuclease